MLVLLRKFLKYLAFNHGLLPGAYRRVCRPNGFEYAEFLRRFGGFQALGDGCSILTTTTFTDPAYVSIGNNVQFSTCALIGHDGAIGMLNSAFDKKLDSVGKIDIKDHVFIGYQAVILPNVTIGPYAIVAAGAVVTKDVARDQIVGGIPARVIGRVSELASRLERQTNELPWSDLIQARDGSFDPALEPLLIEQRVKYFYGLTRK